MRCVFRIYKRHWGFSGSRVKWFNPRVRSSSGEESDSLTEIPRYLLPWEIPCKRHKWVGIANPLLCFPVHRNTQVLQFVCIEHQTAASQGPAKLVAKMLDANLGFGHQDYIVRECQVIETRAILGNLYTHLVVKRCNCPVDDAVE